MDAAYYGLTAAAIVLLVWYYIIYYQAERPRAGTLEWIDRYEKNPRQLDACGKKLGWQDALWALIPAFAAVIISFLLQAFEANDSVSLGVLARFSLFDTTFRLSVEVFCAAIAAVSVYLLGKALTGRSFAALAGALLFAVQPENELYACCLATGLLLFWLWAGYPVRGFKAWALPLCGSLLLGAAAFSIALPAVLVSILATLLFVCIERLREEECGFLSGLLRIAAMLVSAAVGFFGAAALYGEGPYFLAGPGAWLLSILEEQGGILYNWLCAPLWFDRLLRAPLVFSGVVALFVRWIDRNADDALFLLLWALPAALFFFVLPAVLPTVTVGLVCAYLTGRLLERGHPYAAVFGALGAVSAPWLRELLTDYLYLTFHF